VLCHQCIAEYISRFDYGRVDFFAGNPHTAPPKTLRLRCPCCASYLFVADVDFAFKVAHLSNRSLAAWAVDPNARPRDKSPAIVGLPSLEGLEIRRGDGPDFELRCSTIPLHPLQKSTQAPLELCIPHKAPLHLVLGLGYTQTAFTI